MSKLNIKSAIYKTLASGIFIQATTLLQGMVLARALGPEGRGAFMAAIVWPTIIASLGTFSINVYIAKEIGERSVDDQNIEKGDAIVFAFATSIISCCSYFLINTIFDMSSYAKYGIWTSLSLYIVINHITQFSMAIDYGVSDFKKYNIARALLYPINLCLSGALFFMGVKDIEYYLAVLLISNLAPMLYSSWGAVFVNNGYAKKFKKYMAGSMHFWASDLVGPIVQNLDKLIMVAFIGNKDLGIYAAAFSAVSIVNVIPSALAIVGFSVSAANNKNSIFKIIFTSVVAAFAVAISLYLILPWMVEKVYGDSFIESIKVGNIMLFGVVFSSISLVIEQCLRGMGMPLSGAAYKLGALAVFVACFFAFNPNDASSVAIYWVISQGFLLSLFVFKLINSRVI